ncbi:MAG: DUF1343 domain-containing protein, partial [Candidatus Neomarinimicrobiota bacterium]
MTDNKSIKNSLQTIRIMITITLVLLVSGCSSSPGVQSGVQVKTSNDPSTTIPNRIVIPGLVSLLNDPPETFHNKQIALLTNQSGVDLSGIQNVDRFQELFNRQLKVVLSLKAILSPEHGFSGKFGRGESIEYSTTNDEDIRIYSLYGKTKKPLPGMLEGVDLLIYDIQDIGVRYYTYISTLGLAMEAAAEANIPFVVLDRPNPIGGEKVEGPVLDLKQRSFIGFYPIPVRYGMTVGELAKMIVGEKWISPVPELIVIPMDHWTRNMLYGDTNLKWINPSPNIPDVETAVIYSGTCLIEGTNISEGRGTQHPFKLIGAPWIDADILTEKLNEYQLPGVDFKPTYFTPKSLPGVAPYPKYENELCYGIEINITDQEAYLSFNTGIAIITAIYDLYPDQLTFKNQHLLWLLGSEKVLNSLQDRLPAEQVFQIY